MKKIAYWRTSFVLAFFLLTSCSGNLQQSAGPAGEPGSEITFSQFSDIPIPSGGDLDLERTVVIGKNRAEWTGRLVFSNWMSVTENYDFFMSELPKFGWDAIAQVRSEIGILTYSLGNRIMIIKIEDASFWGSEIEMIASPVTKND
ncbi:MAG: hypothetical protein VX198_02335 [Pseudomonadota bacterium]|nr:hypothetical protein [Pseudomonadota bacterium]MEE3206895.1 hypothetical protein [Pseudomonadota bacterium]MEE3260612.1 hypothetical protein [Pseudomonadota bacterium]